VPDDEAVARSGSRGREVIARAARPLVSLGLLLGGLLLAAAFAGIAVQANAVSREADLLRAEIKAEQLRRAALEAILAERQTDDYVIEESRELGFVRPGEALIAVEQGRRAEENITPAPAPSRLARWVALFFGERGGR
jgi:hypothetical protein